MAKMGKNDMPRHINAVRQDFEGNGTLGRILFLPGSDGRAKKISEDWEEREVKLHPRATNLYKGVLTVGGKRIDVAAISTGMGAPSADIILNELKGLGAKNFIRIGTAGSLQPAMVRCGSVVVPTGSVRDESTTTRYLPIEVPVIPSLTFLTAALRASEEWKEGVAVHFGVVHSKDSLYAREFLYGPKREENRKYMEVLRESGVLASEMETSVLFALGMVFNAEETRNGGKGSKVGDACLTGAVLAVVGDDEPFANDALVREAEENAVRLSERVAYYLCGNKESYSTV